MSLLMKALDKATQDRGNTPAANAPALSSQADRELTLEALEPGRNGSAAANRSEPAAERVTYGSTRSSSASATNALRNNAQAQAANVLASGRQPHRAGGFESLRANSLYGFGAAAALFLAAYGVYVYVQISHPGWLTKTGPQPVAATPVTVPPAMPTAPVASAPVSTAATDQAAPPTAETAGSQIVPLSSVFGARNMDTPPSAPAVPQPKAEWPKALPGTVTPPRPATTTPAPRTTATTDTQPPALPPAMQNKIAISRADSAVPRVNPAVSEAYAALQAGQFEAAQRLYGQALRSEPANVDAMLGLAAIAQQQNRNDDAQRLYLAILDVEPRHALAQSGLIALMGRADPQASETRLKQLLAREPSAPLYFNLGNLYADQGLWAQAQQAYFQAHHLEPRNPDYAYNLAVGLEHLGQPKLALDFYRKALQFVSTGNAANFDPARIQERITQLAARVN